MAFAPECGQTAVVTATGNVKASQGILVGYLVCSSSTLTITAYDSAAATTGTMLHNTLTPAAGTFVRAPISFGAGLYLVIGGTGSVAVVYV